MYLNYKNSKVTIADYDPNYGPNGADPKEFLVTDLEISLNANATPSYEIGSRYSTTFSPDNGVNGSLNISYPITGEDHLLDFITNDSGSLSHYRTLSGNFGGLNFSSGYLQNYNLSVTPNNIISANASIVFFGALSGIHQSVDNISPNLDAIDTLVFNSSDTVLVSEEIGEGSEIKSNLNNLTSLSYSYNGSIEPSYEIGEIIPKEIVFGPKTAQCTLQMQSLSGDMPVYGKAGHLFAIFLHPEKPTIGETLNISGSITQRSIRSSAGNFINSTVTIQQAEFFERTLPPLVNEPAGDAKNWGDSVTIRGNSLIDLSLLKIGDIPINEYKINSDSEVSFFVPGGAVSGPLKVYYDVRGLKFSTLDSLQITDPGLNVTGYFLKDSITESYTGRLGDQMVIKGEYFDGVDKVFFVKDSGPQGTKNHTHVETDFEILSKGSDSQILATIPKDCMSGHLYLQSTTRNLTSSNSSRMATRMFVPMPEIDSVSYDVSSVSGPNRRVILSGRAFSSLYEYDNGAGTVVYGTGSINNLSLSPLSGALSSGYEVLTRTGERLGNHKMILGAPKLDAGYPGGVIKINGASGVNANAPVNYNPIVYISGIEANISKSDLAVSNYLASGDIGTDIQITGGNFYSQLLFSVQAHNDDASNAYAIDYNGVTGIVYPDASNPYTILTGSIPSAARSGTLSILNSAGSNHASGLSFSPVYPAPDIKSLLPSSGIAGETITISGYYFENVNKIKLIKRSTSKAGDEIISGVILPRYENNSFTNNITSAEDYRIEHGGASGFLPRLNVNFDANRNSPDLITFTIPSGFRGGNASAGTAGTAGTSFGPYVNSNFLFSGHGIYDVVLEANRGGYVVSGVSTSGLVTMSEPRPSGCYINSSEIDSIHYGDFVNRSVSGAINQEVFISGENLYPGSVVYLNDYSSSNAKSIPTTSYASSAFSDHMHSGEYTGLSFYIPSRTGISSIPLADTGIKIYVKNAKSVSNIKSFYSKTWPTESNKEVKPNDIFVFLEPSVSGFSPAIASQGETVTVSGSFLTGISSVRIGNTELDFDVNYVKTKNSTLSSSWMSTSLSESNIHQTIYGTSFSFQVPTGIYGGEISVTATGGSFSTETSLDIFGALPTIDGFTPKAIDYDRLIHLSGTNLQNVSRVYLSGVDRNYLKAVNNSYYSDSATFNPEYYEEVSCNFELKDSSYTGISITTPTNLARSGYIKFLTKDGREVSSTDQLFLSRIEKINPELSFLNDSKIEVQGINLNYPGLDIRFRGVRNPLSNEEKLSEDYRFVKGSGSISYAGPNYGTDAAWGATGAYLYPNRETMADSIYLVSGGESSQTKANGPHENFFTNSYGMIVGQSQQIFIPQPEISGELRELIPGAGKTYTHGEKITGLSPDTLFFMTGVNCFNVSKNLVGTFTIKDWGNYTAGSSVSFDTFIISKYLTKELSGFHYDEPDKYYPYQGATYKDYVTGSLSGTLTGASISNFDEGYVILSGRIGEGISGSIGIPTNTDATNILYTLCSTYDNNCVFDENLNAPSGGYLNERDCSRKNQANDLSEIRSAEDRINKYLISRDCP